MSYILNNKNLKYHDIIESNAALEYKKQLNPVPDNFLKIIFQELISINERDISEGEIWLNQSEERSLNWQAYHDDLKLYIKSHEKDFQNKNFNDLILKNIANFSLESDEVFSSRIEVLKVLTIEKKLS